MNALPPSTAAVAPNVQRVRILGNPGGTTTARYFHRADLDNTTYETRTPTVAGAFEANIVLCVDPGPSRWAEGFEWTPALTAVYLIDVHQSLAHRTAWTPFADLVFVAQPQYLTAVREAAGHDRVHWLPLAADPSIHTVAGLDRSVDVAFVGQLGPAGSQRRETLTRVLTQFDSNDWERRYKPHEMGRVYSSARIVLNASVRGDLNMRVFEALASGALLVTDRIGNGLGDLFQEGVHYLGYSSPEEAEAQVAAALADEPRRVAIARAGQEAALARHTYRHRLDTVRETAHALGARREAPVRTMSPTQRAVAYAVVHEARRDVRGVLRTMRYQRVVAPILPHAARAAARWVNQRVPLTANARAARRAR